MPAPLLLAPLAPAAKAVAANAVLRTGGALLGKQALKTYGARAAVLLATTAKTTLPTAPSWLTPLISTGAGAFGLLFGINSSLQRKTFVDPSQPTAAPLPEAPRNTTYAIPFNPAESIAVSIDWSYKSTYSDLKNCQNGTIDPNTTPDFTDSGTVTASAVYGLRYTTTARSLQYTCEPGFSSEKLPFLEIEAADDEGSWYSLKKLERDAGIESWSFSNTQPLGSAVTDLQLEVDQKPVKTPSVAFVPWPEPLPQLEPETAPKLYTFEKTWIGAPLKAPKTAEPLPELEPEPLPTPIRRPVKIPVPVLPKVAPVVAPAQVPTTTRTTTQTGTLTEQKKAPVKTTLKTDHFIGKNAGGRISSGGMRATGVHIANEIGRVEAKTKKGLFGPLDAGTILDILGRLLAVQLPTTYELQGVCEPCEGDDCEQPKVEIDIPLAYGFGALAQRVDALVPLLQALKDYKQPICGPEKKNKGGRYFRSIAFESDESTDNSSRRLHKRFRYRSDQPGDCGQLYEHWRCFEWETGATVVKHFGSALGHPQVWARDADEGKRVIRHAAAEAGVDPDQDGQWSIGGGSDPRTGVQRRVKLKEVHGVWAATARIGPSGYANAVETWPEL